MFIKFICPLELEKRWSSPQGERRSLKKQKKARKTKMKKKGKEKGTQKRVRRSSIRIQHKNVRGNKVMIKQ